MKIAILGGGITGLTAAYDLASKKHSVVVFERSSYVGGLAVGFKEKHWDWPLEKAYHHLFANDNDIINFAKEIGFDDIYFSTPHTDSLYNVQGNYRTFPVDSPQDFLRFPLLPLATKLRASVFLAMLKFLPFFSFYERISAQKFVETYMGKDMWEVFFEQLFRKKYGKYSGKVLASFLWARINKRTKSLGYMRNGFQSFIDHLAKLDSELGADIRVSTEVSSIKSVLKGFKVNNEYFDVVISTLPTPVLQNIGKKVFPAKYISSMKKLDYLHAKVLILETKEPILNSTYWLNISTPEIPIMFIGQHTNFVDPKHYGGNHIAYIGYYLERDDEIMKMSKEELTNFVMPYLKDISTTNIQIVNSYDFVGPFAQPIFNKAFLKNKPSFNTPLKNFYIANLDMTYPYDRGTNYA